MNKQYLVTVIDNEPKKERNITKPLGRPVQYQGEQKRRNYNTMLRLGYIDKIKEMAFRQNKTEATIIDEILTKAFSN